MYVLKRVVFTLKLAIMHKSPQYFFLLILLPSFLLFFSLLFLFFLFLKILLFYVVLFTFLFL